MTVELSTDEPWVALATVGDFPMRTRKTVEVNGVRISVFHVPAGYRAVADACPGGFLSAGWLDGNRVACSSGDWVIDLETGRVESEEGGARPGGHAEYPVELRDGIIWLGTEPIRGSGEV